MSCSRIAIERLVLRPLVNQEPIILFMATLGIAFFLDGFGQIVWGSDIYTLDLGIPKQPVIILENCSKAASWSTATTCSPRWSPGSLVVVLAFFFQKTRIGRALRAVADDHQAAQSVGIPLNQIWVIVWTVAGLVALVAGIMWGRSLGVQFSLSLVALKALPVVILGGFTSVPGAIVGGLIIGVGEKIVRGLSAARCSAAASRTGSPTCWRCVFLLFRPQGLFGERHRASAKY